MASVAHGSTIAIHRRYVCLSALRESNGDQVLAELHYYYGSELHGVKLNLSSFDQSTNHQGRRVVAEEQYKRGLFA